jgi:hypothetical protein
LAVASAALLIGWRFEADIAAARARVASGSKLVATRCWWHWHGSPPPALDDSANVISAQAEQTLMQLIGLDFLFWARLHAAADLFDRWPGPALQSRIRLARP